MPIKKIGELCRRYGIFFCVDAAQSAGHLPIDMKDSNISALCLPGHKGLYGPQGCGAILLSDGARLGTLTEGGNGVNSLEGKMPDESPERYESGPLPMPAIAGLRAALRELLKLTPEKIHAHEASLFAHASASLSELGARIYAPNDAGSVLLFDIDGVSSDSLGESLSSDGICVRVGYHCAPLAHRALGTSEGGAVRVSFGIYNTIADVDALALAVKRAKK